MNDSKQKKPRVWLKRGVAAIIFCLVVAGISRTVQKASDQFAIQQKQLDEQIAAQVDRVAALPREASAAMRDEAERELVSLRAQRFQWSSIRWSKLGLASALYGAGMIPSWVFFHLTLSRLSQQPRWMTTFRAFFIGHLGKYVPGKALVVVLRSTLVVGPNVTLRAGVTAVFVETLTMMAVGATLGGVLLLVASGDRSLVMGAALLACLAGIPTIPPVFRQVVARLQRKRGAVMNLEGINGSLMAIGWGLLLIEWCLIGASLATTLLAIPGISPETIWQTQTMCLVTATVSLAIVLGFVSLVPGGAGIREWVVTTALGSVAGIGPIRALVAAILVRFVWLAAELLFALVGQVWGRGPANTPMSE